MEVQVGALGELLEAVRVTTNQLSLLGREIIRVTGTEPDPNADWNLEASITNIVPRLHVMARTMDDVIQSLYDLGVDAGSSDISTLYEVRDTLIDMAEQTSSIPGRMETINNLQSSLGLWINGLSEQSLLLDYILIQSPDKEWPEPVAPWHLRTRMSAYDLLASFTKDYSGVGNVYEDEEVLMCGSLGGAIGPRLSNK